MKNMETNGTLSDVKELLDIYYRGFKEIIEIKQDHKINMIVSAYNHIVNGDYLEAEGILESIPLEDNLYSTINFLLGFIKEKEKRYITALRYYLQSTLYQDSEKERFLKKNIERVSEQINGYTKTQGYEKGYRLRLQCEKEEFIYEYRFSKLPEWFIDRVATQVDLAALSIFYIENSEGYFTNRFANLGYSALGEVTQEDYYQKVMLNNFPVSRREQFRHPIPRLMIQDDKSSQKVKCDIALYMAVSEDWDELTVNEKKEYLSKLVYMARKYTFILLEKNSENLSILNWLKRNIVGQRTITIQEYNVHDRILQYCYIQEIPSNLLGRGIPKGLGVLQTKSILLEIEIEKCRDNNGFSYTDDGHYFVETLRQRELNRDLTYEQSFLKMYYERFTPVNRKENYLFPDRDDYFPLDKGWMFEPWKNPSRSKIRTRRFETRKGGNHNFGPNTSQYGESEFSRLIKAYERLKKHGYSPEYYVDGYIKGYLLIKDDDYRFIITEGQHRIAALAFLEYERIVCRFDLKPRLSSKVELSNIENWPQVKNGFYPKETAEKCFHHFFRRETNKLLSLRMNRETYVSDNL